MLAWLITTPFGFPVVPEVYSSVAGLSGAIIAMRLCHRARVRDPLLRAQPREVRPADETAVPVRAGGRVPDDDLGQAGLRGQGRRQRASWSAPSSTAILTSQSAPGS